MRQALTNLTPATKAEFATELAPCLALTAPAGMTAEDRKAWYAAAHRAIGDVPVDLLRRGAEAALRTADHPSKIVPAIVAAIRESLAWRRQHVARPRSDVPALEKHDVPDDERREVAALMSKLVARIGDGPTA